MDHDVVKEAQCSAGDGVIRTADCSVAVIQNTVLSGRAFNELFEFGSFMAEVAFVKVTKHNHQSLG